MEYKLKTVKASLKIETKISIFFIVSAWLFFAFSREERTAFAPSSIAIKKRVFFIAIGFIMSDSIGHYKHSEFDYKNEFFII